MGVRESLPAPQHIFTAHLGHQLSFKVPKVKAYGSTQQQNSRELVELFMSANFYFYSQSFYKLKIKMEAFGFEPSTSSMTRKTALIV